MSVLAVRSSLISASLQPTFSAALRCTFRCGAQFPIAVGMIALRCFLLAGINASPVIVLAAIISQCVVYFVLSKQKSTAKLEVVSAEQ